MGFNLIDLVKDQLNDQVMGQLGGLLGGSADQNNAAISAAVPGLLTGLMNIGSSSDGASQMLNTINNTDDSLLDNLGGLLSGSGKDSIMQSGSSILGSLLGSGGLGSLVNAIAGFSGLGKGPAKSLLGLLAPVIFGVIKRKLLASGGMNIKGLMNMFSDQKKNIEAAMPAGFKEQLEASGFTNNLAANVTETAQNVAHEGKSLLGRLLPIAIILAVLLFAYNTFFKGGLEEAADTTKEAVSANLNVGGELTGVMDTVTGSLGSITDVESAKAALPQLDKATTKLGSLAGMLDKLPESARGPVMKIVSEGMPQIQSLIDKISAIPGVGPIIKPVADGLLEKLALFQ